MSEIAKASATKAGPDLRVDVMQSQLGRARGLGSAKSGTHHWWVERVTSVALIPLTIWFVIVALRLVGHTRVDVAHWAANPINATLAAALVIVTFHHTQLGLQVVIEDYVHAESLKLPSLLVIKGAAFLLGLAGLLSILKLAFTG